MSLSVSLNNSIVYVNTMVALATWGGVVALLPTLLLAAHEITARKPRDYGSQATRLLVIC